MTTTYWLVIGFIGQIAFGARFCDSMVGLRKKEGKYYPYCVLVLQYCGKCYSANVCNPQRRPGFHSWTKPWFNYLHPKLNSH